MTAERMRHHIAEMQRWQAECDRMAAVFRAGYPAGDLSAMDRLRLDQECGKDEWYKRAAGHRSGHQQAALVYGIAALVELLSDPTRVLHDRVPGVVDGFPGVTSLAPGNQNRSAA